MKTSGIPARECVPQHADGRDAAVRDGLMLVLGTLCAPIQDRGEPGSGITHRIGDAVEITGPRLGRLTNTVDLSDRIPPWAFGLTALMHSLHTRDAAD